MKDYRAIWHKLDRIPRERQEQTRHPHNRLAIMTLAKATESNTPIKTGSSRPLPEALIGLIPGDLNQAAPTCTATFRE